MSNDLGIALGTLGGMAAIAGTLGAATPAVAGAAGAATAGTAAATAAPAIAAAEAIPAATSLAVPTFGASMAGYTAPSLTLGADIALPSAAGATGVAGGVMQNIGPVAKGSEYAAMLGEKTPSIMSYLKEASPYLKGGGAAANMASELVTPPPEQQVLGPSTIDTGQELLNQTQLQRREVGPYNYLLDYVSGGQ